LNILEKNSFLKYLTSLDKTVVVECLTLVSTASYTYSLGLG